MSHYKEQLDGETNYVTMRASLEETSCINVLRTLVDQTLYDASKLETLSSPHPDIAARWHEFKQVRCWLWVTVSRAHNHTCMQAYLELHVHEPRYRFANVETLAPWRVDRS